MDIKTVETRLIAFIEAVTKARILIEQFQGRQIDSLDFQSALAEMLGIDKKYPVELIHQELTSEKIVQLLQHHDFGKHHLEVLTGFTLEESIVPEHLPKLLTEQTVKVKGEIWQVHKNDADPFPSIPHAHNYESGVSLHLGTGELFKKRDSVGQIKCKKLKIIRNKLTKFTLPKLDERCE